MAQPDHTLRHLAFFEALGSLPDGSPDWAVSSAGLVTLRLVDSWLEQPQGAGRWELGAVRGAILAVPPTDPSKALLTGIVDVIEQGAGGVAAVIPRLMAYARALDFAGRWALAADVYTSVLAYADARADIDITIDANFRLAYCLRTLGQLDAAERAYAEAGRISATIHDMSRMLRAEVGAAKVALARGNVPLAERMLDATIARAADPSTRETRAIALHDRSTVAYHRGQYEHAIRFAYAALPDLTRESDRDRVLGDIAADFIALGVRSAARDALLVLAATAQEQYSRWGATLQLLELAVRDGSEPLFEQHRRELSGAPLGPEYRATFELSSGQGFRSFGREQLAREALRRAIAIAEQYGYNRILFSAERELAAMDEGARVERTENKPVPPSVRGIATALEQMRETVTAGAA